MDPLSVSASIIAVATALYSVSRKLRSCAKSIAQAAKEVKAIAQDISAFSILLRSLRNTLDILNPLVSQAAEFWQTCYSLVTQAEDNVREFDNFLEDLEPLRGSRGRNLVTTTVARLRWAFQKSDLLLLRSKLEASKSTLNLFLTAIQTTIAAEQLAAARGNNRNEPEIKGLKTQV